MRARCARDYLKIPEIAVQSARLAGALFEDKAHPLTLSLPVSVAEQNSTDFCVLDGVAICIKMLCDRKTRQVLLNAAWEFTRSVVLAGAGSQRGLGLQGSGLKNAGLQGSKAKFLGL